MEPGHNRNLSLAENLQFQGSKIKVPVLNGTYMGRGGKKKKSLAVLLWAGFTVSSKIHVLTFSHTETVTLSIIISPQY
jgi:hypothetical protein